jgi:hypothetical protein
MSKQTGRGSALAFFVGFVVCYYLVLLAARSIVGSAFIRTWPMVSAFKHRIMLALVICPSLSCVLSMYISSLRLFSFGGMGRDIMTRGKFFATGWSSALLANYFAVVIALRWAIDESVGKPWMEMVGIPRFNLVFELAAPTGAFLGGCLLTLLVEEISAAQNN